jgi:hypothetical protein
MLLLFDTLAVPRFIVFGAKFQDLGEGSKYFQY